MPGEHAAEQRSRYSKATLVVLVVALTITAFDQLTKLWALQTLQMGQRVPIIDGVLEWVLATNSGAAFSFLSDATWLFTLISASVVVVIIVMLHRVRAVNWAVVTGLVLGGAVGNLIDRLFRDPGYGIGHVIDFIYTPWIVPAIYNVADMGVVVGMVLFFLLTILGVGADGRRLRPKREESHDE